jgi:hypothetical protein
MNLSLSPTILKIRSFFTWKEYVKHLITSVCIYFGITFIFIPYEMFLLQVRVFGVAILVNFVGRICVWIFNWLTND